MNWVNDYLLRAKPLSCTALDLYAARCGLLHTFTSEFNSQRLTGARRVFYAYGASSVQDLQSRIDSKNKSQEWVAVHTNDLYEGWKLGLTKFLEELEKNHAKKARVHEKADKFFVDCVLEKQNV